MNKCIQMQFLALCNMIMLLKHLYFLWIIIKIQFHCTSTLFFICMHVVRMFIASAQILTLSIFRDWNSPLLIKTFLLKSSNFASKGTYLNNILLRRYDFLFNKIHVCLFVLNSTETYMYMRLQFSHLQHVCRRSIGNGSF